MRSRLWREPLLHFVVAGTLLFAAHAFLRRRERTVVVDAPVERHLATDFQALRGRPPTRPELDREIERHVQREVVVREAIRRDLVANDAQLKNQLVALFREAEGRAFVVPDPTERELQAFLASRAAEYEVPRRYDFEHAFARRGPEARPRAEGFLRELTAGADVRSLGDPFPEGPVLAAATVPQLDAWLGPAFTRELSRLRAGEAAVIESSHGVHAVRLRLAEGGVPPFAALRERLLRDFRQTARERHVDRVVEELVDGYRVERE